MGVGNVPQHELQAGGQGGVAAPVCVVEVLEDHAPDRPPALRRFRQARAHLQGDDLGQVLMPGDRVDLLRPQPAQPDAVVIGQHVSLHSHPQVPAWGRHEAASLIQRKLAASAAGAASRCGLVPVLGAPWYHGAIMTHSNFYHNV